MLLLNQLNNNISYILLSINYNGIIDILYTSIDQLKHKLDINYTQMYIHYDLYE